MRLLSVIVLTKDEGENIPDLFESLKYLDIPFEVIIFDSFSWDETLKVAKKRNAKAFVSPWKGYSYQRFKALKVASYPWVLFLDADERITPELGKEISRVVLENKADGFYIKRVNVYMGRVQRMRPTKLLRLAKKEKVKITDVPVHEKLVVEGKVLTLKNPMIHYPYKSLLHHWQKNTQYAALFSGSSKKSGYFQIFFRFPMVFLKYYILNLAILDGVEGLIFSLSQAWYHVQKYALLYERGKGI
ncbi:MAG: glycosyltransferase family 2 protein [candidate division WOR-3 bacterium]